MNPELECKATSGRSNLLYAYEWLTPIRFVLILAAFVAAFFPDILWGGRSLYFKDFGAYTYPNAFFQRESFWHGEIPLWNPLNNCGIPYLAQWNTSALYPLSLIYLILPLTWGLNVFLLVHLVLAGLGMYLLASRWTKNRLAAAVAGVAFAFNGMTLNCLEWTSNLGALAWMPWVILAAEQAWTRGGRNIILAALVGTMQMLAGAPEVIALSWLVVAALGIDSMIIHQGQRGRIFGRLSLTALIVALLSAAQLLPFWDLLQHSDRTSTFGASIWTIPTWGWANLFVPLFHQYQDTSGVYFQPNQDWTSSYFLGAGILTLAGAALALAGSRRVWMLWGFALFGFIVAMGDEGIIYHGLTKYVPILGFMRYPIKFFFLTVFAIPLLAAFAIATLGNGETAASKRNVRWTLSISVLSIAVIAGILWHVFAHPFPNEHPWILLRNGAFRVLFLVLMVGAILVLGRIQNVRRQMITGLLPLVLVWLDVVTHVPRQNPTIKSSAFEPGLLTNYFKSPLRNGDARALRNGPSYDFFFHHELADPYKDYVGRRGVLFGDCNIMDGIPTPDGLYSLYLPDQQELFSQFILSPTNAFPSGFADFLSASVQSDPGNLFGWQNRPSALPFYTFGPRPIFLKSSEIPTALVQTNFDPRQIVYLPQESKKYVNASGQVHGTIHLRDIAAERWDFDTEAGAAALLVLSQAYYHPWRAYVDGKPTEILPANFAFQAVEVPAGRHRVRFIYQDRFFQVGGWITLVTLTSCIAFLLPRRERG